MLRQAGPYALIAGFCASLNIAILIAGDAVGLHYALSTVLSFVACVCVGYTLHCRWTFRAEPSVEGVARYAAAMGINLPLGLAGVWLFYQTLRLPMGLAAPAATVSLTIANFALSRWAILPRGARK
jgi:putative flippase GtrA